VGTSSLVGVVGMIEMAVLVLGGITGLVIGSFLNVCIYRLPRRESLAFPASHCPLCQHPIAWYDNVPVLAWLLWLRQRCRHCHQPVSWRYPLVELLAAVLTVMVLVVFGRTPESGFLILLGYALIVLTMIDLEHYILPDVITLGGLGTGLLIAVAGELLAGPAGWRAPFPGWLDACLGAGIAYGGLRGFSWLFARISGRDGMGMGDVKLFALFGAWFGWQGLPFILFGSALAGTCVGVVWIVVAGRDRHLPIPFGPYLALAAWLYIFIGGQTYDWYFHQFMR
jgi:leader peptidase (prepilin peptidase)/N-methyltransferase